METIISPAVSDDAAQLRASLHRFVDETNDTAMLQALLTILTSARLPEPLPGEPVRLEDLPPAVRESVEAGLRDIEAGRVVPHEQVMAEMRTRYGRAL